ncbi:LOW QUALITY PROTEIN: solute carrier family 25 member 53-like [Leucoraja erinacea]|uniref:LOW QUALITY PROTEIN: solute carrier family 25 member 53-like n=1 Tax=Leucoraja erinaceus TaxID=7782 RepID=UPI0024558C8B|nr:LOW QUALITY PROTEIN: solute carrier family 25 member 53-like [Leucoraja erinacea]
MTRRTFLENTTGGIHSQEAKMQQNTEDSAITAVVTSLKNCGIGATSSCLATVLTFPIHKTIFRQQIHGIIVRKAFAQLRQEGLRRFYRGLLPPLLAKTIQGTLLFGTYDSIIGSLMSENTNVYRRCIAGSLSGAVEALVLTPFERVQNILQDHRKEAKLPTIQSIFKQFNSYSFQDKLQLGYYRGFLPVLLRNGIGSALYFSLKDPIKNVLLKKDIPSGISAFISGSFNGMVVCFILYPLSAVIANMQSQIGKEKINLKNFVKNFWASRAKSFLYVYRGGSLIMLRSCITWGLTTVIHDFLKQMQS